MFLLIKEFLKTSFESVNLQQIAANPDDYLNNLNSVFALVLKLASCFNSPLWQSGILSGMKLSSLKKTGKGAYIDRINKFCLFLFSCLKDAIKFCLSLGQNPLEKKILTYPPVYLYTGGCLCTTSKNCLRR